MLEEMIDYMEKNFHVETDKGVIPVKISKLQKYLLERIENNNILFDVFPRQEGISSLLVFYVVYYVLNNNGKNILITSDTYTRSIVSFEKIKNLLLRFRSDIINNNTLLTVNQNRIWLWKPNDNALGFNPDLVICDNFTYFKYKSKQSVYSLANMNRFDNNRKVIAISTEEY